MPGQIPTGQIHHLRLTVTDVERSRRFYTSLRAVQLLDAAGVTHGEITSLPSFEIDVLSFEDPDGVQLELTAPMG